MSGAIFDPQHWDRQYRRGRVEWDTGAPSSELCRVLAAYSLSPCSAVDLGCGTGTNAIWLAERGFEVTAVDLSEEAVHLARQKAAARRADVRFIAANLIDAIALLGPFDFFLDSGCFPNVRRGAGDGYLRAVAGATRPG